MTASPAGAAPGSADLGTGEAAAGESAPRASGPSGPLRSLLILAAAIAAFVAIVSAAGWVRSLELTTSTWDLGIYQQALWSAGHGRGFYEAPDWETGGFGSFLQVHSAFVLYAVAPLYNAVPTAATLYVVQALVVALAAVPLYGIVRSAGGSTDRGLGVALLYLVSAPVVSSSLYDFHVEAFVPVEIFALFYFWHRRQYGYGAVVAVVAYLTMEATPVFAAAVGLYFLTDTVWTASAATPAAAERGGTRWTDFLRAVVPRRATGELVASAALIVGSVAAYYALLAARMVYLGSALGVAPFPVTEVGYVIGGSPANLGLSLSYLGIGLSAKVGYWLLLFALVLLLPFRSPRTLLLVAPWAAFTFFSADLGYVTLGYQYGFLASAGMFPGVALGAVAWRIPPWRPRPSIEPARPARWRGYGPRVGPITVALAAVVVFNVGLTPFDPLVQSAGLGSGYNFGYAVGPSFAEVRTLASLIPPGAPVLASDFLFPFVANDLHAYSLFSQRDPTLVLPFNYTMPPAYVFLAQSRFDAVPDWLALQLYNRSDFGMPGLVWGTPVGAVSLFEWHYNASLFEEGPPPPANVVLPAAALEWTPIVTLVHDGLSPTGVALDSTPFASGQLWSSAPLNLPAGCYNFTFWVRSWATVGAQPPPFPMPVMGLEGNPFSETGWFSDDLNYSTTAHTGYWGVTFEQRTAQPVFSVVLRGYALTWQAGVGISSITISEVSCPPPPALIPPTAPG